MDNTEEYKVFISYAWTTPEHERWVNDLAKRLTEDGVEVKYDKWDLKVGQDKYAFMESMVQDVSINKVLLICDRGYKEKADTRAGGVGTETQIITSEIYDKVNQEKFIPIIAEKGEKFDAYMPIYLRSRIGIDLSTFEVFEDGYEQLLRSIAEKPLYRRPKKGKMPSYLFEDEKSYFKTTNIVKNISNCIFKNPNQVQYLVNDFIDEFKNSLNEFQIDPANFNEPYDEIIYNNIIDMTKLRDDYINLVALTCRDSSIFNIDIIINLFEDIYSFTEFQGNGSYKSIMFDHYKFFINELFLYTVSILIENDKIQELNLLLANNYFLNTKFDHEKRHYFNNFRFYVPSLDEIRNNRMNLRRVSVMADLLMQRSVINNKNYKEKLLEADLLLYYISKFKSFDRYSLWFPTTYIYHEGRKMNLLRKLVSRRHFEKIKFLFDINTAEEMITLIDKLNETDHGYSNSFERIPHIRSFIKPEELCSCP